MKSGNVVETMAAAAHARHVALTLNHHKGAQTHTHVNYVEMVLSGQFISRPQTFVENANVTGASTDEQN